MAGAAGEADAILNGRGRGGGNRGGGRGKKNAASKKSAADQAKLAAFLLNKYGAGGSRLAAAEAVATSADEEVVCARGRRRARSATRSCVARPCRWTSEAVSLDNLGGMRGVARCAARELARVGKTKPVKAGARTVNLLGYICSKMVKAGSCP